MRIESDYQHAYLTKRYVLAVFIIAIFSTLTFVSVFIFLDDQKDDAALINISGRQRMLSQRIALYANSMAYYENIGDEQAYQFSQIDLKKWIDLMASSHRALLYGNPDIGIYGTELSEELNAIYHEPPHLLHDAVTTYLKHARVLVATPYGEMGLYNSHLEYITRAAKGELLTTLNQVVSAYQRESEMKVQMLGWLKIALWFFTLIVLLLEILLIFRPMVRRVVRTTNDLRKLFQAVEQTESNILITNLDGTIEFVNPAFTRLSGYAYNEVVGKTPNFLKSGVHSASLYREMWNTISQDEVWRGECLNRGKQGNLYWQHMVISPVKDAYGKTTHYVAVQNDITPLKKVQKNMENHLQFINTLLNTIPIPIFYKNKELKYEGCNQAFLEFMGKIKEDLIGQTVYDLYVQQELAREHAQHDQELLANEFGSKTVYIAEIPRFDGKLRDVIFYKALYHDAEGEIAGIVGTFIDITELKETKRQLELHNEELQTANEQLEQYMRELSTLKEEHVVALNHAYERFVPHGLLNLLKSGGVTDIGLGDQTEKSITIMFTDIRGFTAMSENMSPQETFNFVNEYLSQMQPIIDEYGGEIDKYIGDAIMAVFPNKVDDALRCAIAMLGALKKYNHTRQQQGEQAIIVGIGMNYGLAMLGTVGGQSRMDTTVISDAVNLAARVENLTKTYSVPLLITENVYDQLETLDTYEIRIIDRVKVKGKENKVTLYEIFSADSLEQIRLKQHTMQDYEEGVLSFHRGEYLEAKLLFDYVLGQNPDDLPARHYLTRCEEFLNIALNQHPRVMIVDDTPANISVLFEFLTSHEFEVMVAEDGESALEAILHDPPHLVLMDVMMPGMDGYEACERLKANDKTKDIPVIFMTALGDIEHKVKGFSLGAVDYITKPFDQQEVLARINNHLKIRYLQQQLQERLMQQFSGHVD